MQLLLFDAAEDAGPSAVIDLDPKRNRTAHYWHIFLPELKTGQVYAYRVQGPANDEAGHRYNSEKVLLDPYAKCIAGANYRRDAARYPGDNVASAMKCVVTGTRNFDWRQIQWHGEKPRQPDWNENSHSLAFTRMGFQGCEQQLILLNAYWEALQFGLPSPLAGSAGWLRFVDTSFDSPFDVNEPTRAPLIDSPICNVRPRSVVVLICRKLSPTPPN